MIESAIKTFNLFFVAARRSLFPIWDLFFALPINSAQDWWWWWSELSYYVVEVYDKNVRYVKNGFECKPVVAYLHLNLSSLFGTKLRPYLKSWITRIVFSEGFLFAFLEADFLIFRCCLLSAKNLKRAEEDNTISWHWHEELETKSKIKQSIYFLLLTFLQLYNRLFHWLDEGTAWKTRKKDISISSKINTGRFYWKYEYLLLSVVFLVLFLGNTIDMLHSYLFCLPKKQLMREKKDSIVSFFFFFFPHPIFLDGNNYRCLIRLSEVLIFLCHWLRSDNDLKGFQRRRK